MFNFYSRKHYVPGASDLLMARFVELAREQGKRLINLGLGIHAGVVFFKKKWGAEVYLRQQSCRLEIKARRSFESLLEDYLK